MLNAGEQIGPLKTWHSSIVRKVCRWISVRSQGRGYGSVGSRKHRRPFLRANGRLRLEVMEGGSLLVTAVRPLDSVVEERLLDRPGCSPRAAAEALDSTAARAFLRSEEVPDVEEDLRCAWEAARALVVWFAACL